VNPQQLIFTGATQLRSVFPSEQLPGILRAYLDGIKASFAVAIGMTGISFVVSLLVPWKRLPVGAAGAVPAG
jgi:MFS transporter, DHA2 family, glioxin efflux transporter